MVEPRSIRYRDAAVTYAGVPGENMVIRSANPTNYHQVITEPDRCEPIDIDGKLFVPAASDGSAASAQPTVIVVPGSLGVGPNHERHAETLVEAGFVVFVLDPFGARDVGSTVVNQTAYSFAASAFDVVATVRELSARPEVDASRIAAQGHSRGGAAVLMASCRRFVDPILGPDAGLAASYAVYPWCGQQFLDPTVGRTRVRSIIGERDEWCSVQEAQGQINAMRASGADASIRIVGGAMHSFDRLEEPTLLADASIAPNAPTVMVDDDGAMIDPISGEPDATLTDWDVFVASAKRGWAVKGASIGGVGDEPDIFKADMLAFHESLRS